MLVVCASDNKGRSVFISRMLRSSLLLQTPFIAIENITIIMLKKNPLSL